MANWPTRADGSNKTVGEMTAEERATVFGDALARIKAEFEHPEMQRALAELLTEGTPPSKGQTRPSAEMAQGMARRLANSTADAYSHHTYGHEAWLACCALLLRRGYSEREAEAIMRSKWTRWAADGAKTDKPGAEDLARFLDNPRNQCTPNAVQELVTGTLTD